MRSVVKSFDKPTGLATPLLNRCFTLPGQDGIILWLNIRPRILVVVCAAKLLFATKENRVLIVPKQTSLGEVFPAMGVVGSRWAPRSSKPVAGRVAGRGGFDSHPLPPPLDG